MLSDAIWTPRFPHSSVQPSPSAAASQPQLRRRPRAAGRMRTRYSVVSHEALAVSHGSPAPLAPPIFGPAAVHDVSSPILLPLSQPYHPRASTRRAVAGARPGLICEAVLWAKLEPYTRGARPSQSVGPHARPLCGRFSPCPQKAPLWRPSTGATLWRSNSSNRHVQRSQCTRTRSTQTQ